MKTFMLILFLGVLAFLAISNGDAVIEFVQNSIAQFQNN